MSHKNLNPTAPGSPKRVAIVLSNPAVSSTTGWPVGYLVGRTDPPLLQVHRSRLRGRAVQPARRPM